MSLHATVLTETKPEETTFLRDRACRHILRDGDTLEHESLPGFGLDVAALFERARH